MLRSDGHDVAQVLRTKAPSPLDAIGIPALVVPTPADAVDVLSACRGVIGVDTGLTHIAAQQSTPTVTICRQSSVYVRPWPHCAALRAARCTDQCLDSESVYAYNQTVSLRGFRPPMRRCPSGAPCPGRHPARGRRQPPPGAPVITRLVHHEVDAWADAGVRNSQPEGIGRVVALRDLVCWNNLGRNVVFADDGLRPLAVFGTTLVSGRRRGLAVRP